MSLRRAIMVSAGLVCAGAACWWGVQRFYLRPRAALLDEISLYRGDIEAKQEQIDELRDIRRRLAQIGATSLAREIDTMEHRLRTELVALAEKAGLSGVEVTSGRPIAQRNPVGRARIRETSLRSTLRDQVDFSIVRATLDGTGRLEEVARTMALLQAQPWVARVDSFSIKPVQDKRRFDLTVNLTTLFVPDLAEQSPAPALAEIPEPTEAMAERIASRNVFRKPDPPPPVIVQKTPEPEPAPPAPPPAPPAPGYGDWRLAGVMRGLSGVSAIMVNSKTRETRTLAPGEDVLGFIFVSGEGEQAEFSRDGQTFVIRNGETLAQRRELE
ncbi:MAG: hypothetical protein ACF8R7_14505 [Phycisphaerales bacterium JB039]